MLATFKTRLKATALVVPLIALKRLFVRPRAQNDEAAIIAALVERHDVPRCFVELGFSGWEFNCAALVDRWSGLLIDGDRYNVIIARTIMPRTIVARHLWLTLDTLDVVAQFARHRDIGILSIDVDGNDYWFLERLIVLRPAIIVCEYNSVLGQRSITIPYDANFNRNEFGDGWYFGASLAALVGLARRHGYALVAQAAGINAFFLREDLLAPGEATLTAAEAYEARFVEKWAEIEQLPFVDVEP